jgi:16S rRNA (adenine1518-N6/adenine1519-N6)-dimethyltransferase
MRGERRNPPVLKRFGQHFLTDRKVLASIVESIAPEPGDTVVEIGPGRGVLTDELAMLPNKLVAIEVDHLLSENLRERYHSNERVKIVEADVLETNLASLAGGSYVVAGNVPYYITTPILFHVLHRPLPRHIVLLVQREVAERITASPGSKQYGALSVNVQVAADAEIIRHVPPGAFSPPPKVDSAVIRIIPRAESLIADDEAERFRSFVQGLFGMRRKQIGNVLRSVTQLSATDAVRVLESLGIEPRARPETLSVADFVSLMRGQFEMLRDVGGLRYFRDSSERK